jgi:hypothetical protein
MKKIRHSLNEQLLIFLENNQNLHWLQKKPPLEILILLSLFIFGNI